VQKKAVCGRFTLTASPESVERAFGLDETPQLLARFNVAPGQDVATIHQADDGRRLLALRRWGLVPHWAKDPKIGARLINARAETADAKPSFRDAIRRRRCLVPADGFYEWAAAGSGPRQPYWVALKDGACFGIAGLYERWKSPEGEWIETCTLLTTRANERLRPIHDRMPVILAPADYPLWLDTALREPERLHPLLRPFPDEMLQLRPVSRRVNRPEHDDPRCIAPLEPGAPA
jgi:putative SOS response-associated peptidase YedK